MCDRDGIPIKRYAPNAKPNECEDDIVELLGKPATAQPAPGVDEGELPELAPEASPTSETNNESSAMHKPEKEEEVEEVELLAAVAAPTIAANELFDPSTSSSAPIAAETDENPSVTHDKQEEKDLEDSEAKISPPVDATPTEQPSSVAPTDPPTTSSVPSNEDVVVESPRASEPEKLEQVDQE